MYLPREWKEQEKKGAKENLSEDSLLAFIKGQRCLGASSLHHLHSLSHTYITSYIVAGSFISRRSLSHPKKSK